MVLQIKSGIRLQVFNRVCKVNGWQIILLEHTTHNGDENGKSGANNTMPIITYNANMPDKILFISILSGI